MYLILFVFCFVFQTLLTELVSEWILIRDSHERDTQRICVCVCVCVFTYVCVCGWACTCALVHTV